MAGRRGIQIKILGDAAGLNRALGQAGGALGRFGQRAGAAMRKFSLATAAATAGVGAALMGIESTWGDATDAIRVGTGETGANLEALTDDFRAVGKQVPQDLREVGQTIADLNTRTGATGPTLQALARDVLDLSRITKTDLATNVAASTRMFGDWTITTDNQAEALNKIFRASQSSGIGVDRLMELMTQFGSPLRQLGLDFDTTAAMFSRFEREGVVIETALPGLKMALKNFAKAGREPGEALAETFDKIRQAGSAAEANTLAFKTFGARAGPDLAAAIREGRFDLDELRESIVNGDDTIGKASKHIEGFKEQWLKLKNRVFLALGPIATRLFDTLGRGVANLAPVFDRFMVGMRALGAAFSGEGVTSDGFVGKMERVGVVLRAIVDEVVARWPAVRETLMDVFRRVSEIGTEAITGLAMVFGSLAAFIAETVVPMVLFFWGVASRTLIPVLTRVATVITKTVLPAISKAIDWLNRNKAIFYAIAGVIAAVVIPHLVALGVQSTVAAAKQAAAWVVSKTQAIAAVAVHSAQVAVMVAKWVFMGAQAMLHAAKIAAAWLVAIGPVGIVIAVVAGLVALVIKHWDTIKGAILGAARAVIGWLQQNWPLLLAILTGPFGLAVKFVVDHWDSIVDFVSRLPGRIASAASGMWDGIKDAFRAAVNWIIRAWNGLEFRIPGFDPPGPGPKFGGFTLGLPDVPELHTGGIFKPRGGGGEGLAMLERGEGVFTPEQMAALGGGAGGIKIGTVIMGRNEGAAALARHLRWLQMSRGVRGRGR